MHDALQVLAEAKDSGTKMIYKKIDAGASPEAAAAAAAAADSPPTSTKLGRVCWPLPVPPQALRPPPQGPPL